MHITNKDSENVQRQVKSINTIKHALNHNTIMLIAIYLLSNYFYNLTINLQLFSTEFIK